MVIDVGRSRRSRYVLWAISTWQIFWRGRNITNEVYYVDTRRRVARAYVRNDEGRFFIDPVDGRVSSTVYRGRGLEVRRPKRTATWLK